MEQSAILRFVCSVLLLIAVGSSEHGTVTAQSGSAHTHPSKTPGEVASSVNLSAGPLPIAADGAKNPELISDDLAYRHFIMAVAISERATERQIARRNAMLSLIGLENADRLAMLKSVATVRASLDRITESRRRIPVKDMISVSVRASLAALKTEEDGIFRDARNRMAFSLSHDGSQRLDQHIQSRVKRRIVIYGEMPPLN